MNAPISLNKPGRDMADQASFFALPEQPVSRQVLALVWPVLLQQWLVVAVNFSDRLLGGWSGHTTAQAAQTTAAYLAWFLTVYTVLVSLGSTTLVAHLVGAGDRRTARLVLHQSLLLAAVLGLAGTVVGLLVLKPVLALLQLRGESAALAAEYLRPLLLVLPLQMIGAAGLACLAGAGDTRTGMWVLGGVAVLNVPLAWMFVYGIGPIPALGVPGILIPALGFPGIAVGTAVSQGLGGLVVVGVLFHGRAGLRLEGQLLRPRWDLIRRLMRVSVPAALDQFSMQVGHLWFLGIVNSLGDVPAAAHGVALTWEALGYQSGSAFGTAAVTVVGQSLGAGQPERAARGGWLAFGLGAGWMSLMGVLFVTLAAPMFYLFCPSPDQAEVVQAGVPVLRLVAVGMPALASTLILAAALRGAGDVRVPMLFTWIGFFVVRIPLAYLLTSEWLNLGLLGAWLAMCADLQVRGLFVLGRFASGGWRGIRV
jgi:putative MATE family efflux protein